MKKINKIMISTAILGQVDVGQWKEVVEFMETVLEREGLGEYGVGFEIVASFREPFLSLMMNKVRRVGLGDRVETIHGRVDYDLQAIEGRMKAIRGMKKIELLVYDYLMAEAGEAYRAARKFKNAKLLLHAPTLFELEVSRVPKPKMDYKYLIVENDEKIEFPFGDEQLQLKMKKLGNPLNPVDVLKFVKRKKCSKMVFDSAHVWRSYKGEVEEVWNEFKELLSKSRVIIYWHMNHNNGKHFILKNKSKHDQWMREVIRFAGKRIKWGDDQVCFEEPRKVRLRLSKKEMREVKNGLEKSIVCLKEIRGL